MHGNFTCVQIVHHLSTSIYNCSLWYQLKAIEFGIKRGLYLPCCINVGNIVEWHLILLRNLHVKYFLMCSRNSKTDLNVWHCAIWKGTFIVNLVHTGNIEHIFMRLVDIKDKFLLVRLTYLTKTWKQIINLFYTWMRRFRSKSVTILKKVAGLITTLKWKRLVSWWVKIHWTKELVHIFLVVDTTIGKKCID